MKWISAGGVDWHIEEHGHPENEILVLLHGFAGSMRSWDPLLSELERHFRLLLIDLPGHGDTPLPTAKDFSLSDLYQALGELILQECSDPPILCGYSMGGRIALHLGVYSSPILHGLVLIGASPGIENEVERSKRAHDDEQLADKIVANGIGWFAEFWAAQPIFATQKELPRETQERLRRMRMACAPQGLAYALRRFGTGRQEFFGHQLKKLRAPLLLMAGSRDLKFCTSNRAIAQHCGSANVQRIEIADAGHAVHIEKPEAVVREIITFDELIENDISGEL